MEDVDGGSGPHGLIEVLECRQQEAVKAAGVHVVVFDGAVLPAPFLSQVGFEELCLCAVVHVVGRVGDHQVELLPREQLRHVIGVGGVTAHEPVTSKTPDAPGPADRHVDGLRRCVRVEVIFLGLRRHLGQLDQVFQVGALESGHAEVVALQVKLHQEVFQQLVVPLAGDLIEGGVQGFLFGLVPDVQDDDLRFLVSEIHHHCPALVALDDGAIEVDYDGVCVPELQDRPLDVLVLLVLRGQLFSGIVFSGPQISEFSPLKLQVLPLLRLKFSGLRNEMLKKFSILSENPSRLPRPALGGGCR